MIPKKICLPPSPRLPSPIESMNMLVEQPSDFDRSAVLSFITATISVSWSMVKGWVSVICGIGGVGKNVMDGKSDARLICFPI